jgi:hypothetical protein
MTNLIFHTDCRNRVKFSTRDMHEILWVVCKFHKTKAGNAVLFLLVKIKLQLRVYGKSTCHYDSTDRLCHIRILGHEINNLQSFKRLHQWVRHTAHKTCKSPPSCFKHMLYLAFSREFLLTIMLKIEVYILTAHELFPNLARHIDLCDCVPEQDKHSDQTTGYFSLLQSVRCVKRPGRETDSLPPHSSKD